MGSASISVDEFQALEQKVLQTVELIKREREARAAAEAEVAAVKTELAARKEELESRGQEIVASAAGVGGCGRCECRSEESAA